MAEATTLTHSASVAIPSFHRWWRMFDASQRVKPAVTAALCTYLAGVYTFGDTALAIFPSIALLILGRKPAHRAASRLIDKVPALNASLLALTAFLSCIRQGMVFELHDSGLHYAGFSLWNMRYSMTSWNPVDGYSATSLVQDLVGMDPAFYIGPEFSWWRDWSFVLQATPVGTAATVSFCLAITTMVLCGSLALVAAGGSIRSLRDAFNRS